MRFRLNNLGKEIKENAGSARTSEIEQFTTVLIDLGIATQRRGKANPTEKRGWDPRKIPTAVNGSDVIHWGLDG